MTKTEEGLALIDNGMTVRQAARQVDMSESALHSAVKRRKDAEMAERGICPACGRTVKDLSSLQLLHESVLQKLDHTAKEHAGTERGET